MRLVLTLITCCVVATIGNAQAKSISKVEYKKLFDYAVSATNDDFPFVFTVTTEFVENGKIVRTVTEIHQRQARLLEHSIRITTTSQSTATQYQISVGFANNFCSEDGKTWIPSPYMCFGPVSFYGADKVRSVERTVNEENVNGKTLRVLREFTAFPPSRTEKKQRFREELSTIDSRGFFISIETNEGTLNPKTVALIRKQVWTKEKFDSVTAPK